MKKVKTVGSWQWGVKIGKSVFRAFRVLHLVGRADVDVIKDGARASRVE